MKSKPKEKLDSIIILDFGSQYTALIAKKIRKFSVYAEVLRYSVPLEVLKQDHVKAIILSGGPKSIYEEDSFSLSFPIEELVKLNKPVLGICYGMHLIIHGFKGKIKESFSGEYGSMPIRLDENHKSLLFKGVPNEFSVWMSHMDSVESLPEGFTSIAKTGGVNPFCAAAQKDNFYLLQFHPEVFHTQYSDEILFNFIKSIVKIPKLWDMQDSLNDLISDIYKKIQHSKVVCAVSGGVDSMVTAVLLHKAISNNLICIFVDHGLLRKNEAEYVIKLFKDFFDIPLTFIDARDEFLKSIENVSDPEEKRKIIGGLFIKVFEREARKHKGVDFLAQGTLYSDLIESQSSPYSHKIKSHHNVAGLPKKMNLKLIEPLRSFFKDEVRELGKLLHIPDFVLNRHPFPGPGLAIRILGNITEKKIEILQKADAIFIEEIEKAQLYGKIWQAFAVLSSDLSVGVKGDQRVYGHTIVLRSVSSIDAMTAEAYSFSIDFLKKIANRICNEIKEVNRVAYDLSSKPPSTIEWE